MKEISAPSLEHADSSTPNPDEKTALIVRAARDVFLTHGYDGASMDEIAHQAGVSKRTVYTRFRSKEALFGAAIEETCKTLLPIDLHDLEMDLPPRAMLTALSRRFLQGVLRPEAIFLRRVTTFEAGRAPHIGEAYLLSGPEHMAAKVAPTIERLTARGVLRPCDPRRALWRLASLVMEPLFTRVLLGTTPDDLDAEIEAQVEKGVDDFLRLYGA